MSEVFALEQQLNSAKDALQRRAIALKLSENPEFKKLVLEEFCIQECARYAQLSADPALDERQQKDALAISQSAGHLRRFLSAIITMGNQADRLIPDLEAEIELARAEENE